jgi:hypothetical protein
MNAMLTSRKEADELAKQYDIRPQPAAASAAAAAAGGDAEAGAGAAAGGEEGPAAIPDGVIMKMLAREALLTVRRLRLGILDQVVLRKGRGKTGARSKAVGNPDAVFWGCRLVWLCSVYLRRSLACSSDSARAFLAMISCKCLFCC